MSERFQANTSHRPGKCRAEADFGIRYRDMEAGLPVYAPSAGDCQQEADFRGRIRLYWQESLRLELQARSEEGGDIDADVSMLLEDASFKPGMRSVFNINIVGNDFIIQVESEDAWEDGGDSDIVFE